MANKASHTHALTGFHTKRSPPDFYRTNQANRILIVRNAERVTTKHNLKSSSYEADWIINQGVEVIICFINRQDLVAFCSTHETHIFGPHAKYYIPTTATKPAPWTIIKNKLRVDDKGIF